MAGDRPLNERQQRFVEHYIATGNGAASVRAAGYSSKRADDYAHDLLKDPRIRAAVDAARSETRARARKSADDVLERLEQLAFATLRDVADWGPGRLDLREAAGLPDGAAAAVKKVKVKHGEHGVELGIELHDPIKPLLALAQHHGLVGKGAEGGVDAPAAPASGAAFAFSDPFGELARERDPQP